MNILLRFLLKYEVFIYFLLGLVVVVFLRRIFIAWRQWRAAIFGIEKEHSQFQFNQGLTIVIFSAFVALTLFVVTTFVAPAVPNLQQVTTPTVDLTAQATQAEGIAAQVTQTTTGLIPTLNSLFDKGCIAGQIEWTNPTDGETISGTIDLQGTVNVTDLGSYKYEYRAVGSQDWTTIAAGSTKVVNGSLGGNWDTSVDNIVPGDYELHLIVYDHQNKAFPECMIQVTVVSQ
jgi:hypothetical protein